MISCHGSKDDIIYDSNWQKISLKKSFIYFNVQTSIYLADKPKLFFVDCCRGSVMPSPIRVQMSETDGMNVDEKQQKKDVIRIISIGRDENNCCFQTDANFCIVYGTTEGYLLQSFKNVFMTKEFVLKNNLESIIKQMRNLHQQF